MCRFFFLSELCSVCFFFLLKQILFRLIFFQRNFVCFVFLLMRALFGLFLGGARKNENKIIDCIRDLQRVDVSESWPLLYRDSFHEARTTPVSVAIGTLLENSGIPPRSMGTAFTFPFLPPASLTALKLFNLTDSRLKW